METKTVGKQMPKTPEEFHALGARLDLEARVLDPDRPHGFVVKFRTWEDLERWEKNRLIEQARRMRAG
jgi:Trm5-related predicted tRNA methylase